MSAGVSPSTFSTLLRHSKFASYDPAINQVYTSFGGYAHRGHWGIKRDLPPKRKHKVQDPLVSSSGSRGSSRRNPVAFISGLDSAEGQTEWTSAEKDVRWLRRLEELGSGTYLSDTSSWSKRVGSSSGRLVGNVDSEFDSTESAQKTSQQMTSALPNIQAMSERQFKAYIAHLRGKRAEFHEFLQQVVSREEKGAIPMYAYARTTSAYHTQFLAHINQKSAIQPESNTLTPVPHPSGGLDYLNPTPLMSQLLYPNPVKGRYIQAPERGSKIALAMKYDSTGIASVAGYTAVLQADDSSASVRPIEWHKLVERDFSQPMNQASSKYRVEKLELYEVPSVVGKSRQNIEGAAIKIRVRDWSKRPQEQANPYRPGTFDYVSHEDTRTFDATPVSMKTIPNVLGMPLEIAQNRTETNAKMMDILDQILDKQQHPEKKFTGKP